LKLYDEGFDLWFPYNRGTIYSRKNANYSQYDPEFWDFSWYDNGMIDNRVELDFIYERTGQKSNMMGFSQGTTQIFAAVAADPDYYETRIHKVAQFAPCAVTKEDMYSIINDVSVKIIQKLGIVDVGGPNWYKDIPKIAALLGREKVWGTLISGWGTRLMDVSTKALLHYA